jgi:F-type H+-transporting ATPase subunit b
MNWFTIVAQIVNFLVLVALLKHFLWDRLVRAIDQREARIAGELAKAEEKYQAAQQQMEQVQALALQQEHKGDELMAQAQKKADEQRINMVQRARENVRRLEAEWQEDLERERATFFKELRKRAGLEILTIARQAIGDLASTDLQSSAIRVFMEKLRLTDSFTLRKLAEGEVRSAAELPENVRREIEMILAEKLGAPSHLLFRRDPSMPWGIELRGTGLKIGWSPDSYLDVIEENLKAELERPEAAFRAVAK